MYPGSPGHHRKSYIFTFSTLDRGKRKNLRLVQTYKKIFPTCPRVHQTTFVPIWDFFSYLYPALKTWKCMISRWCPGYLNYWLFSPEIRHLPPIFLDKKVEISKHDQIDPTSTIKILTKKQKWKNENFKYVAYMHCFKDIINNRENISYILYVCTTVLPPTCIRTAGSCIQLETNDVTLLSQ